MYKSKKYAIVNLRYIKVFRAKISVTYCSIYNTHRNKMYDNKSTKAWRGKAWKYTAARFLQYTLRGIILFEHR